MKKNCSSPAKKPSHYIPATSTTVYRFFFYQNPLSQIGLVVIKDGVAQSLIDLGGSPESHIKALMGKLGCSGEASLHNALELVHEQLDQIPSYGHREVIILYSALSTCDPGDVIDTIQAVGTSGVETAMGVFLGLVGRCHVSAGAAIRVVQRVVGDSLSGEGARASAKLVAEFVSNDKVVSLFSGELVAKERSGMHSLLWNWNLVGEPCSDFLRDWSYCMHSCIGTPSTWED